jgi:isoquinoline 1-oxidoreductase beta subunit
MRAGAAAGGGLMLGLSLPFANQRAEAADAEGFVPNAFIRVGGDGQIVLTMSYVEMGQGTYTSISMLIADELEVELKQVTGGACSAERKALLVAAAAKRWNVDPASCRAQGGEVLHPPTGRSAKYGELAANAARLPVPQNVPLKRQQDFKLIGTPAKRLDTPAKVNGTAVYGIDARPPGVKIATLAQSPVDQARRVFNNPHELRELRQTRDMGAR